MEKCKLCSRVGESIKIKLSRVCESAWFAIFVYICWFMTGCMYLFHNFVRFSTFVSPLGLHFSTHLQWCWPSISMTFFNQNIQIKAESWGGHLWHILGKGGTGSLLGSVWRQLAGWRLKTHLEARSHIMCLTLERNVKVALQLWFYEIGRASCRERV